MFEVGLVLLVLTICWLAIIIFRLATKREMAKSKLQLKLALITLILSVFFLYHGSGPKIDVQNISSLNKISLSVTI